MSKIWRFIEKVFVNDNHHQEEPIIVDGVLINANLNSNMPSDDELEETSGKVYNILNGSDVSEFKEHLAKTGRSARTIRDYVYDIKGFASEYDLLLISARDIEKFLEPVGPAAAKRKLSALRSFARFIMDTFNDNRLFAETYKVELKK